MKLNVYFGLLVLALSSNAIARVVYFGSETEVVRLPYGTPTLFRFPSEVRTITQAQRYVIKPADSEQPNYSLLSIEPRFLNGVGNVSFMLGDGSIIRTRLVVTGKNLDNGDGVYEFRSKESLLSEGEASGGPKLSEIELMKALIRGDEAFGFEAKNSSKTVTPGFKGVTTKLIRRYLGDKLVGYIFEVTNITENKNLSINVQNLMLGDPNQAIVSNVEPQVIAPGKTALLRIVGKTTALYDNLMLPVQIVEKR